MQYIIHNFTKGRPLELKTRNIPIKELKIIMKREETAKKFMPPGKKLTKVLVSEIIVSSHVKAVGNN